MTDTYYIQRMGHQDVETDPHEAAKRWHASRLIDGLTKCRLNDPVNGKVVVPYSWWAPKKPRNKDHWAYNVTALWAENNNKATIALFQICIANTDASDPDFINFGPRAVSYVTRASYDVHHYAGGTWDPSA